MQAVGGGSGEPEPLVESGSALVSRVDEHRASPDQLGCLEGSQRGVGHERPPVSLALQRPIDSKPRKQDDTDRMGRHAPGMPVWKLAAVNRARCQRVIAQHTSAAGEHVGASGPGSVGHPREPPQPIIKLDGAAVELIELMITREERDPKVGQDLIS